MAEHHARGLRTETLQAQWPEIGVAFELYLSCRQQQLFHMEVQKDKGKRLEHKLVLFTTGYLFPAPGGILDQPDWLTTMFDCFMSGERAAAMRELKK